MSNFIEVPLEKIGVTITGKTPSSNNPEDFGSDFMFVTPSDSFDQKEICKTERYLSKIGFKKLISKSLPEQSVLVTCIGSAMGKIAKNRTICITNQQINSIKIDNKYDSDYIYYSLKNNYKLLRNAASGSTALPLLNKTDFDKIRITIHQNKTTQQKIASVLSSLDAKIELNNRINAELEAMARTLYDYWFVQFDFPAPSPSGRAGVGLPYKSSGGKMVWNEDLKREIPEGWFVDILGNHIKINRGISYTGADLKGNGIPMINLNSFYLDGRYKTEGLKYFSGTINGNKEIKAGDLMLATTDVTRNAYIIGKSFILPDLFEGQVVASCDIAYAEVGDKLDKYYLDMLFNSDDYHRYIKGFASGTLVLHLNTKGIEWYKCIIPSKDLLNKFNKIKSNIELKKSLIIKENQQLSTLRDWLLPMLMNGQVKVADTEEEKLSMAAEPEGEYK